MSSEEDLFSEFLLYWRNGDENEVNVEVLSISPALPIWSHIIDNLITLFAWALLWNSRIRAKSFALLTSPRGSVHKAKVSSLSLQFYSKALVRGY